VSLIFHAPQSAGELLDVSLGIVKRHVGLLCRIGIWPVLGIAAVDLASRTFPDSTVVGMLTLWVTFAVYGWGEAAVSLAAWRLLHREPVTPSSVWEMVRRRMGSVAIGYTLKWIGMFLGLVFFLVPAALLLVRWFAVPAANVIEGLGVRAGFRRSRELARGNRWQIFVTIALLDLSMIVLSLTVAAMLMDETDPQLPLWFSVINWVWTMLYLLFHATLSAALYANARVRNEGYDVESLLPAAVGAGQ
jgi:hypothetical protein